MRSSLPAAAFFALLTGALGGAAPAAAQQARTGSVLDETMVPEGRVRPQLSVIFSSWNRRFGRADDGTEGLEPLGQDLTDPTSLSLFPGVPTLQDAVRTATGLPDWDPVLGSSSGRVKQDVTTIDLGLHIGVFDWLTVGAVLPRIQPRTVVDYLFVPDTTGANLGINPAITNSTAVESFLTSAAAADAAAGQYATSACGGGPSATCTDAQALSARATAFAAAMQAGYGASPFFPLSGTTAADALDAEAQQLSADLAAVGLAGLTPAALATDALTAEAMATLPSLVGGGIEMAPLQSRKGLWGQGDLELSARVRVLDNMTPEWATERTYSVQRAAARAAGPWLRYRLTASFLTRLPTGLNEDPDVPLDVGRGDAQLDFEGGATASLRFGRLFGLTAGGRYGIQGSTTLVKRVATPETVLPPLSTRQQVTYDPGSYLILGVAPVLFVSEGLSLHGEYRYVHKGTDAFELVSAVAGLDPTVLELESGIEQHQMGGGLRYDAVAPWTAGSEGYPIEVHFRVMHTFNGSGGQTPEVTRVETGVRIFQRIWGPRR